ncbi:MAG: methylmalonyl-CoA mutase family protein, partial [Bacteroidota bacterium]
RHRRQGPAASVRRVFPGRPRRRTHPGRHGGAYYAEKMTDMLAEWAWAEFLELEEKGGYMSFLWRGNPQEKAEAWREGRAKKVNKGRTVLIGVNRFPDVTTPPQTLGKPVFLAHETNETPGFKAAVNADVETRGEQLTELFAGPELGYANAWWDYLAQISDERPEGYNWMDQEVWASVKFDGLRGKVAAAEADNDSELAPCFLLTFGNLKMRKARANFALNLLGCGGLRSVENPAPDDWNGTLEAIDSESKGNDAPALIVLCAANEDYFEQGPEMLKKLKAKYPSCPLILAGNPKEWEKLKEHGLDDSMYMGMDMLSWLDEMVEGILNGKEVRHEA